METFQSIDLHADSTDPVELIEEESADSGPAPIDFRAFSLKRQRQPQFY